MTTKAVMDKHRPNGIRKLISNHRTQLVLRCKIVVVGDACTGKTAIAQLFTSSGQHYPKNYLMTTGVDFSARQVKVPNRECIVEMLLFDCAGQGIFNQLDINAKNWENASFICLVYDVSNKESFQSCGRWLQSVRAACPPNQSISGVLIANKTDLREAGRGLVGPEEGAEFARENGLSFFEVSAAMQKGIDLPFNHMAHQFYELEKDRNFN